MRKSTIFAIKKAGFAMNPQNPSTRLITLPDPCYQKQIEARCKVIKVKCRVMKKIRPKVGKSCEGE